MSAPDHHLSRDLSGLLERLAEGVAQAPLSPHQREVVVVPSAGLRRWVTLELARRLGIAAGISLPFPTTFAQRLADAVLAEEDEAAGTDRDGSDEAFQRTTVAWRLFFRLGDVGRTPEEAPLAHYLRDDPEQLKRWQLATRLSVCFEDYVLYRREMLTAWEDGQEDPENRDGVWQARLWRFLVESGESPARRQTRLLEKLERGEVRAETLPPRVWVLGSPVFPPDFRRLLNALARHVPVTLLSQVPCQPEAFGRERVPPLLRLGARTGGEFGGGEVAGLADEAPTLLTALQSDLHQGIDRGVTAEPRELEAADDSLQVHVCHSPLREMEVLRDQLLDAFERDATLAPDDVLVLVPDIREYASSIEAVFGIAREPALPFTIADRPEAEEEPLIRAFARTLQVLRGRLPVREVFDLLECAAIRRRFDLPWTELASLRRWVESAGIRWGIDGPSREEHFDLPDVETHSWRRGIERLLLGYSTGAREEMVLGMVPAPEVSGSEAELLGRFLDLTDVLFAAARDLRTARSLGEWRERLLDLVDALFRASEESEEAALTRIRRVLSQLDEGGSEIEVHPAVIRAHLDDAFAGPGSGGAYVTGRITFASLRPQRTVPRRLVWIAGLSSEAFPGRDRPLPFDLRARHPRDGDRTRRDDDGYLFLDTVQSAGDRLGLSYVGRSLKDGSALPPSLVVSEVIEAIDRGYRVAGEKPSIVVEHPLHPFDARYFAGEARHFTYSRESARVSAVAAAPRTEPDPFVTAPLPEDDEEIELTLEDLLAFWRHPTRAYCRRSLELWLRGETRVHDDAEPFLLGGLGSYLLEQDVLQRRLRGEAGGEEERRLLEDQVAVPISGLGEASYSRLRDGVDRFATGLAGTRFLEPVQVLVTGDGWRIGARLDGLTPDARVQFRLAKAKSADRLSAWITHLVLNAVPDDVPRTTRLLARDGEWVYAPVAEAQEMLATLVDGFRAGLREPLPFFPATSLAFAEAEFAEKKNPLGPARTEWNGPWGRTRGEKDDPFIELCFRGVDVWTDGIDDFREWARRVWKPILQGQREVLA